MLCHLFHLRTIELIFVKFYIGFDFRQGQDFLSCHRVYTVSGAHPASFRVVFGELPSRIHTPEYSPRCGPGVEVTNAFMYVHMHTPVYVLVARCSWHVGKDENTCFHSLRRLLTLILFCCFSLMLVIS
jgi:hypothetical protein